MLWRSPAKNLKKIAKPTIDFVLCSFSLLYLYGLLYPIIWHEISHMIPNSNGPDNNNIITSPLAALFIYNPKASGARQIGTEIVLIKQMLHVTRFRILITCRCTIWLFTSVLQDLNF